MIARIASAAIAAATLAGPAHAQELRIGFLTNFTGPGAPQGVHQRAGWQLGLEHEGWTKDGDKLGGVPTRIYSGDDQAKPDVGMREIDKMLTAEKVQVVVGFLWSHVLNAGVKPLIENNKIVISTVPGALSPRAARYAAMKPEWSVLWPRGPSG